MSPEQQPSSSKVETNETDSRKCKYCKKIVKSVKTRCSKCKSVFYCSKSCQKRDWGNHKALCGAIDHLEQQRAKKVSESTTFATTMSPKSKAKLANLVGERCVIACQLNEVDTEVLLDTGAQVSLITQNQLRQISPNTEVRNVAELLDEQDSLRVQWGNSSSIPFVGWVELPMSIGEEEHQIVSNIPFLVLTEDLENTLVGFNAIKDLFNSGDGHMLIKIFKGALNLSSSTKVESFVNLIKADENEAVVKIKGKDVTLSPGKITQVSCKANLGFLPKKLAMLFSQSDAFELVHGAEPIDCIVQVSPGTRNYFNVQIANNTKHMITLRKNCIIGHLEQVKSITPLDVSIGLG